MHGATHYAVATAADNIRHNFGEYRPAHTELENIAMDSMCGGSPYGVALTICINYSISFNLDRSTPPFDRTMGSGVSDEMAGASPENLGSRYEIPSGLRHLKKPVEMYYYPSEEHLPDQPEARLASIQRNIDRYRFWLQDYERPHPEDPKQYDRWHELRRQPNCAGLHGK